MRINFVQNWFRTFWEMVKNHKNRLKNDVLRIWGSALEKDRNVIWNEALTYDMKLNFPLFIQTTIEGYRGFWPLSQKVFNQFRSRFVLIINNYLFYNIIVPGAPSEARYLFALLQLKAICPPPHPTLQFLHF